MIESESRTLNGPLGGCIVGNVLCCFFCLSLPALAARPSDPGGSSDPWGESSSAGGSSSQAGAVLGETMDADGLQKRPLRVRWCVAGRQPLYWPL